jgi:NADPH:quinone reductase-like Zn-dependent oxidoreductase
MRAIVYTEYGPPEVAQLKEVAKPVPKQDEVLIKVHASTVNRTDCAFRSAEYFINRLFSGLFEPKNKILGNEFAGEIEAVGEEVKSFGPGDKVFGYNDKTFGAHAEYMVMAADAAITTMPENISFAQAAAITEGAHYALCDIRAAKIQPGQYYLVNGATGGIGSAAVQFAKYFGAEVTAVCDTRNVELVRSLGAHQVIDYTKQDFTAINKSFDVVFDAVGKSSFSKCKPLLREKGIYMSTELGYMAQNPFLALLTPLLGGKKVLFPIPSINKEDVVFLKELVEAGHYKPVVDRCYGLEQIVDAYRYVETGQKTGNVVITISQNSKVTDN